MFYVYELLRPDGSPFYVGKSQWRSRTRLKEHLYMARSGHQDRKCQAIRDIESSGHAVGIAVVFETDDENAALLEEKRRIGVYGLRSLTNQTTGGPHVRGFTFSEESRRRMSEARAGVPLAPTHRERIASALRGTPLTPERCAKIGAANRGKRRTNEQRAMLRAAHVGRRAKTPEQVARSSGELSGSAKLTWEKVGLIRDMRSRGAKLREIAELVGVSVSSVSKVANRQMWKGSI